MASCAVNSDTVESDNKAALEHGHSPRAHPLRRVDSHNVAEADGPEHGEDEVEAHDLPSLSAEHGASLAITAPAADHGRSADGLAGAKFVSRTPPGRVPLRTH